MRAYKILERVIVMKKCFFNEKGGAEITQSFLLIGVAIALVLSVFFPNVKKALDVSSEKLSDWMLESASSVFGVKAE